MSAYARAEALLDDLRRYDLAEQELRRYLQANPEDGYALTLLARALGAQEKLDEAMQTVLEAVRLVPDYGYAHRIKGWLWEKQKKWKQAEDAFREALRLDATDMRTYQALAYNLWCQDRNKEALAIADQGLTLQADHVGCLNHRALALKDLHRFAEARKTLESALSIDPTEAITHANMGWLWKQQGERNKAVQWFLSALELDPENAKARAEVQDYYHTLGLRILLLAIGLLITAMVYYFRGPDKQFPLKECKQLATQNLYLAMAWLAALIGRRKALQIAALNLMQWGGVVSTLGHQRRARTVGIAAGVLTLAALFPWSGWLSAEMASWLFALFLLLGWPWFMLLPEPTDFVPRRRWFFAGWAFVLGILGLVLLNLQSGEAIVVWIVLVAGSVMLLIVQRE